MFPHQKSLEEKGDLALEEERRLAYVGITRAKRSLFIFCHEKSLPWRLDGCASSRFINEIPENSIEKNELNITETDEFDFNQDISIDFGNEYRSPGGIGIKKINQSNGKNKKLKKIFIRENIDGYIIPKMMNFWRIYCRG